MREFCCAVEAGRLIRVSQAICLMGLALLLGNGCSGPPQAQEVKANRSSDAPETEQTEVVAKPPEGSGVLMELWYHLDGGNIADLTQNRTFPNSPTQREIIPSLELPKEYGDFYGVRWRAWLTPPRTGKYRFWIAADDLGEFWLSSDNTSENKSKLCFNPNWTAPRQWDQSSEQRSDWVSLVAGQRYYLEVLMKQEGGGEHLSVAWEGPELARKIVSAQYLSPVPVPRTESARR